MDTLNMLTSINKSKKMNSITASGTTRGSFFTTSLLLVRVKQNKNKKHCGIRNNQQNQHAFLAINSNL